MREAARPCSDLKVEDKVTHRLKRAQVELEDSQVARVHALGLDNVFHLLRVADRAHDKRVLALQEGLERREAEAGGRASDDDQALAERLEAEAQHRGELKGLGRFGRNSA